MGTKLRVWRAFRPLALLFVIVSSGLSAFASEPPTEPALRIETGMHTAVIRRIGVDDDNRYLVTGSDDKTVRVWELSTGRPIRTIRPPIGENQEGKIYAVALSPDGGTIACGGWTGWDWEGSAYVYLFDRETGRMTNRITGLPNVAFHLAFSKDGRYLAVGLGRGKGLRVYNTRDLSLAAEDTDYADAIYGIDWDRSGRLAAVSWDGYIRLYDGKLRRIEKRRGPGGTQPFSVSFSPSGEIAVAYNDTVKVDVFSGDDLYYLYSPDTSGTDGSNLMAVAWSADGRYLYAAGKYQKRYDDAWHHAMRKWSQKGKGPYVEFPVSNNTVMEVLPLARGGIVIGAYDPAFKVFDSGDYKVAGQEPSIGDLRGLEQNFRVSYDGSIVQFYYEYASDVFTDFSVLNRTLTDTWDPTGNLELRPPKQSDDRLNVTEWEDSYTPKVNGKALELDQYEKSRSLAIAPNGQGFVLGTEWYLHSYDGDGRELWSTAMPGVAWSVNVSGNGRVAVAALGDGTIRWYRMTDGKELMAFFPHKDKKRWVLWTSSGYYDASTGAEELIGWHLNNGKGSASDFFPVSKFRSTYYRPDVTAKMLDVANEPEAIRLADQEAGRKTQQVAIEKMLPPVVTIISPSSGTEVSSSDVIVRFMVRSPSGETVTGVKALVDGRPVATERGVELKPKDGDMREIKVAVPDRDSEISVIAENKFASSEPATIKVKWAGRKTEEFVAKPKLYVLAVGVSRYIDKDLTLKFAAKDAKDFADAVAKQKGALYRDVVVKLLTDETATKDEILDGLDWIRQETTSKDVAIVFIAGHGVNDQSGIYYFLPANANTDKLMRTGVAFTDVKNTLASLAGKTVLFVDTCHSGNVMGTSSRRGSTDINAVVNELSSAENGAVVFASSTGRQYSLEDAAWGNGAFTKALIEGLSGKADMMGSGKITINMLDLYLSERVKELTKGKQTPTTTKPQTVPDFPVAVKR